MILSFKQWLAEAMQIPETRYGYWIDLEGGFRVVEPMQHQGVARKILVSAGLDQTMDDTESLLNMGYVRVAKYPSYKNDKHSLTLNLMTYNIEFNRDAVSKRALRSTIEMLNQEEDAVEATLDIQRQQGRSGYEYVRNTDKKSIIKKINSYVAGAKSTNPMLKRAA